MIDSIIKDYAEKFENRLTETIGSSSEKYSVIYDACRYSLLLGGKRLRPFLINEFYKLCGGDGDSFYFQAAIECIHTYSLIHDDLPCMDDDDMRRGKPSCHICYGEATALLAGDALLTKAFGLATECSGISAERKLSAIKLLADCAGIDGMIGGQVVDLMYEDKAADDETLKLICSLKTGALIKAACLIGATLAGADEAKCKAAVLFAEKIGLAFQIVDDILDEIGSAEKLGKPIHSDQNNGKSTFVTIYGIDYCKKLVVALTQEAKAALSVFGNAADNLKELADFLCNRDY